MERLKKMKKYIFLDIDGVINPIGNDAVKEDSIYSLVSLLNEIKSNNFLPVIVISSSWRLMNNLNDIILYLGKEVKSLTHEFDIICSKEIYTNFENNDGKETQINNRYLEIKNYLEEHNIQFNNYVILDDSNGLFFKKHLNNIKYLIYNYLGQKINENTVDENNNLEFDNFTDIEIDINKSFVDTSKKEGLYFNAYLSYKNIEDCIRILKLN